MSGQTQGAIVYLDDNNVDLRLMQSCHGLSTCDRPLLTMQQPSELLEHMRSVVAGQQPRPELVLIDIRMPAMDGFQVFAELEALMGGRVPPVVFFTTSRRVEDERTARSLGARLVRKPNDIDEYVSLLNNCFSE